LPLFEFGSQKKPFFFFFWAISGKQMVCLVLSGRHEGGEKKGINNLKDKKNIQNKI
jgi:hypothetical protein